MSILRLLIYLSFSQKFEIYVALSMLSYYPKSQHSDTISLLLYINYTLANHNGSNTQSDNKIRQLRRRFFYLDSTTTANISHSCARVCQ
ncbi:hypothetical protein PILCRDRAFT_527431 [Piloderma croceum F 1598]|uniref:Uncharacterized protein n=1 Tax=Piloderma croceum (strain F 1598) TaxID=765440 RepID=A0A0C3F7L5_PILCF|nr:hypothetical protein PILCRDRAFT_527431 [Piloderma croceum F 1598]